MADDQKIEAQNEVKAPTVQDFTSSYYKLCEEMGYRIVASPVWIARDDGTFSMQIQITVGKLPKRNGESTTK